MDKDNPKKAKSGKRTPFVNFLLLAVRFLLFAVLLFTVIWLIMNTLIFSTPYWQAAMNLGDDNTENQMNDVMERVAIPEKADEDGIFYDINDFPQIYLYDKWAEMTISWTDSQGTPMNISGSVYNGDSMDILAYDNNRAIGKYANSTFPGQGGKIVFCGHVMTVFYQLEEVPLGTVVTLDTIYGKYEYTVTSTKIFTTSDVNVVLPDDTLTSETLVMYTCYPRGYALRSQRYALICEKTSGVDWK